MKAIVVSRDRLRESAVTTRYIDVIPNEEYQQSVNRYMSGRESPCVSSSSVSDADDAAYPQFLKGFGAGDMAELQGSVEGPINPVNYSGTQINVWGFPTPELVDYLKPKPQVQTGFLTEQMIKVAI